MTPLLVPAMEREGYRRDVAAAVVAGASIKGPIGPLSIMFIVYGSLIGSASSQFQRLGAHLLHTSGVRIVQAVLTIPLDCFTKNGLPRNSQLTMKRPGQGRFLNPQPGRLPRLGAMELDRADTLRARCKHPETARVKFP